MLHLCRFVGVLTLLAYGLKIAVGCDPETTDKSKAQ